MTRLLAINGSYREGGMTDQAVDVAANTARQLGAKVEIVWLRETDIGFCHNCRACTQQPGEAPGVCLQPDEMAGLIGKIEAADGYILATPTNFFSATAIFKRFMERLIPYAYWPWGKPGPEFRKKKAVKRAIRIASSGAPGWMGRLMFATQSQLKKTARAIGARTVATVSLGLKATAQQPNLTARDRRRIEAATRRLLA